MRFKITFKVEHPGQLLPMSYQYELSSWIYKLLYSGNNEFAQFLHDQGYQMGNKRYKFFSFSRLYFSNYKKLDDRFKIMDSHISFWLSFYVDEAAQNLILGLFQHKRLRLGDIVSQVDLSVERIETAPLEIATETVKLQTISPLVVTKYEYKENGKTRHIYLPPNSEHFEECFFQNLMNKYSTAYEHGFISKVDFTAPMELKVFPERVRKKGITIKAHTKEQTKVIGYDFLDFELTAPKELIRLGLLAGFGNMNATGFGAARII